MTTFEKAMAGDGRAIERYFFDSKGATRSDEECHIIFNLKLDYQERLRRVAALREADSLNKQPRKATRPAVAHIPFELLISQVDAIHARALGVQLG